MDLDDDAPLVLELSDARAADQRETCARRSVATDDVGRAAHVIGDAIDFAASEAEYTDADAADSDRVHDTAKRQATFAASGPDKPLASTYSLSDVCALAADKPVVRAATKTRKLMQERLYVRHAFAIAL